MCQDATDEISWAILSPMTLFGTLVPKICKMLAGLGWAGLSWAGQWGLTIKRGTCRPKLSSSQTHQEPRVPTTLRPALVQRREQGRISAMFILHKTNLKNYSPIYWAGHSVLKKELKMFTRFCARIQIHTHTYTRGAKKVYTHFKRCY